MSTTNGDGDNGATESPLREADPEFQGHVRMAEALLFAAVASAYILVAIQFEERDLMHAHPEYAEYRRRVPMLVPAWPKDVAAHQPPHTVRT